MQDSGQEVPSGDSKASNTIKIQTKGGSPAQENNRRAEKPKGKVTELSFLLELLLEHKLSPHTKKAISDRIRDVELSLNAQSAQDPYLARAPMAMPAPPPRINTGVQQSASMQAIIDRNPDILGHQAPTVAIAPVAAPIVQVPPQQIAQTPAAQAAMASRAAAISQAISGKPEKGQVAPRKF